MKKLFVTLLAIMMAASLMGCGSSSDVASTQETAQDVATAEPAQETTQETKEVTIKIMSWLADPVQSGIEVMNQEFMDSHPGVTIEYEAVTGDDYRTVLQTRFASGDGPDIFMNAGYSWLDTFKQYMSPITDEEWAQYLPEASRQRWGSDGEYYGYPINLQSISFVYNKDLFEQAGITVLPTTFTELKAACEKLEAIGVTPFALPGAITSRLAHSFNVALGHHDDPLAFIADLRAGTASCAEDEAFNQWADFFEYTVQHSYGDVLTCDDDTIYTLLATGQVGMIQAGSWCEGSLLAINPDLKLGIIPMCINDDASSNLIAGDAADGFSITENENTEISKELVAYWALSDAGVNIYKEYHMIPAMTNCNYDVSGLGQILQDADQYFKEGKYFGWYWYDFPDLTADMQFGAIMQAFISGSIDKQQMLEQFDAKIVELEAKAQ